MNPDALEDCERLSDVVDSLKLERLSCIHIAEDDLQKALTQYSKLTIPTWRALNALRKWRGWRRTTENAGCCDWDSWNAEDRTDECSY